MNTKRILVIFSMLASVLFTTNITFTRGGWDVAGPVITTGAILGTTAAISSSAARDARYREEEARRRERNAERRHKERMAAINARNQGYVQPPMDVDYE